MMMADPEASISSVEERELPEAVVDDIRSRLSPGDIIRSNLVCKGWAAVSETPYFLQLWRERLPCTTPTWGLEVQVRSGGEEGNFKVVNFKALDSSTQSSRLVAADLQAPDLWRQQYYEIKACCSADGLICLMGYHWPSECRRIMVANPLTKEPPHVLPHAPLKCSNLHKWEPVMHMVADPGSEGHYKVLLASYEDDQLDSDDESDTYDRYVYVYPRFTAIYSSRTGTWQDRGHALSEEELMPRTLVVPIGDMVYMAEQVESRTYGFVARNIHEALPDPEHDHEKGYCSWGKTWPAASWKGVQIPRIVVRREVEHTMQLLACLGHLLMVTVPDIFEFLPSEARWVQAFTMPSGMKERFKAPKGCRYRKICQCFEQDGAVRFVNGENGVGIILDVRANAWSVDAVRHGSHPDEYNKEDRCFALAFRPSLRPARGGSRIPLGDHLARRPRRSSVDDAYSDGLLASVDYACSDSLLASVDDAWSDSILASVDEAYSHGLLASVEARVEALVRFYADVLVILAHLGLLAVLAIVLLHLVWLVVKPWAWVPWMEETFQWLFR